jgi:TetR/AcrR family transcriptional regulator, cholesterol catabolism regulator
MAPRPDRPALRERYDRKQEDVVLRAAAVFARQGYDQTSVSDLAAALGIAAGGLYHYFGSKEQLLIAICDQLMEPLLEETRAILDDDDPPVEQLRRVTRAWVAHVVSHADHMLVFQQERHMLDHGPQWRAIRDSRKRFEALVDGVLARVADDGHAAFADRRVALSALLGMVNHTAQWFAPRGRLSAQALADGYVDLVVR